jgi:general secretion pathway protein D
MGFGGIGRQNVGITLKVTPYINDDNQVRLEIDLEISEVKSIDPVTGPTISKQNAVTTSVVADQQTIVIGGLITDNQVETTTKVPVLGDIPILGMLFRHKSSLTKKRNLLIFLTPYIVRSAEDFKEIFSRKMAERREFIERYTAFEYHRYDPHLDWSRTNGAVAVVEQVIGQAAKDEELKQMSTGIPADAHNPKRPIDLPQGIRVGAEGGAAEVDESGEAPVDQPATLVAPGIVGDSQGNVP